MITAPTQTCPEMAAVKPERPRGRWKAVRWLLLTAGMLLAVGLLGLAVKDPVLKRIAERRIRSQTGLATQIGQMETSLSSASVRVRDFKIQNPDEFGGSTLLDVPELTLQIDPARSGDNGVYFKRVRLHLKQVTLVRSKDGHFNWETLTKLRARSSREERGERSGTASKATRGIAGIDQLSLTLEHIRYVDMKDPSKSRFFDLDFHNQTAMGLTNSTELNRWASSLLVRALIQEYYKNPEQFRGTSLRQLLRGAAKGRAH